MTTCVICGRKFFGNYCPDCRGWACDICHQPAYRDESVIYIAIGNYHQRCSDGIARPRPPHMPERPERKGE